MASLLSFPPMSRAQQPIPPVSAQAPKPLVVIIEDDYRSALALVMVMDDWGFTAIAGRSTAEAVQALGSRLAKTSAIVADVNLNGEFRGIRDAKALAAAIGRPVPIIVTTGYSSLADAACDLPILRKPFDPNLLRNWLEHKLFGG